MLYAKLIWIVINWAIFWELTIYIWHKNQTFLSIIKTFKTLKNRLKDFQNAIAKGYWSILKFVKDIIEISPKKHKLEKKKNQLSSLEILMMFVV